jgi:hypothetical protein
LEPIEEQGRCKSEGLKKAFQMEEFQKYFFYLMKLFLGLLGCATNQDSLLLAALWYFILSKYIMSGFLRYCVLMQMDGMDLNGLNFMKDSQKP